MTIDIVRVTECFRIEQPTGMLMGQITRLENSENLKIPFVQNTFKIYLCQEYSVQ